MNSLRNFVNIMRLQKLWRAEHRGQLPCDGNPSAGDEPERSCAEPLVDIISTEKAQPLLGSDNVVRVTPERGDWRSQAPANSASFMDDEIAGRQMDESPSALQRSEAADPEATTTASDEDKQTDRQALFIAVQQARAMRARQDVHRSTRGDDEPSEKTIADYRKKVALLIKAMKAVPVDASNVTADREAHRVWLLSYALGEYAGNSNSYFAMRAAIQWTQYRLLKALLKRQDRWQKQLRKSLQLQASTQSAEMSRSHPELESTASSAKRLLEESGMRRWQTLLQQTMLRIQRLEALSREDCLAALLGSARQDASANQESIQPPAVDGLPKSHTHSSIKALMGRLNKHRPQWQSEFRAANEVPAMYRSQALIQSLTGIRPTEFDPNKTVPKVKTRSAMNDASPGVVVTLTARNTLLVRVPGGKVRQKAGQVERSFELQIGSEIPAWFLDELREAGGSKRYFANPDALAKHYSRVSKRMFATAPSESTRIL